MKSILLLSLSLLMFTTISCDKKTLKMKIVRDCTGVYLQKDGKDHFVCNATILSSYSDGDKIKVQYDVLNECFGLINQPICLLYHEHEDVIEITKIK